MGDIIKFPQKRVKPSTGPKNGKVLSMKEHKQKKSMADFVERVKATKKTIDSKLENPKPKGGKVIRFPKERVTPPKTQPKPGKVLPFKKPDGPKPKPKPPGKVLKLKPSGRTRILSGKRAPVKPIYPKGLTIDKALEMGGKLVDKPPLRLKRSLMKPVKKGGAFGRVLRKAGKFIAKKGAKTALKAIPIAGSVLSAFDAEAAGAGSDLPTRHKHRVPEETPAMKRARIKRFKERQGRAPRSK